MEKAVRLLGVFDFWILVGEARRAGQTGLAIQHQEQESAFAPESVIFRISVFDRKPTADQAADPIPNVS
jgi:hypothetical protein